MLARERVLVCGPGNHECSMLASDVIGTDRHRTYKWALCAILIALAHVGIGAWSLVTPQNDAVDDEVNGAIVMNLAPLDASQRTDPSDNPVGLPSEESVPTPPTTEKVDDLKPLDLRQFQQSLLALEPEVAMPIAKPVDEPKSEEELKEVQPENLAPQQTTSAQAMAPPQLVVKEATVITAQQVGESLKKSKQHLTFQNSIRFHVKKHQRYPSDARDRNHQGTVIVEFTIDRSGRLTGRKLSQSSGFSDLDEEALATLDRANPFPLPPDDENDELYRFKLPIQFHIK